ncbi:MAG: hypothetical protein R3E53_10060 [Myxococcota bacterium]
MPSTERLISSDDHVVSPTTPSSVTSRQYHAAYDDALMRFGAAMAARRAWTRTRWREQHARAGGPEREPDAEPRGRRHPAAGRAGHTDAKARLEDLTTDGIDASVLYYEVSAFAISTS